MSNTFGQNLRVTTFGESHGSAVGAVIDGFPANILLSESDIQAQLDRRRPGQSAITTPRCESDAVRILSGVEGGRTLGTPIALVVENKDMRPKDYAAPDACDIPRPSHADYTYIMKYGIKSQSGGGRASARETVGRVAAGAAAEKFLLEKYGVEIVAFVSAVGHTKTLVIDGSEVLSLDGLYTGRVDIGKISRNDVDKYPVRCPDGSAAKEMEKLIKNAKEENDSIGGIVTCVCRNVPAGWGEPVFQKLEAQLASAMMSIPAAKGFEIGSGFDGAAMRGSEHNDLFVKKQDVLGTKTNMSGGVQGGISNGEPIYFNIAFKPTATIGKDQRTANYDGKTVTLKSAGRHDPCVVPRAVPVVEAMAALVLADAALAQSMRM